MFAGRCFAVAALLLLLVGTNQARGGLTAENVVVVVNGDSHDSRTIANHYVALRNIPASNVVVLENVPDGLVVGLEAFRDRILRPVLKQIETRKIAGQTSAIVYSAGFPTSVDISPHVDRMDDENIQQYQRPKASITGLTFFYRFVLSDDPNYLNWYSNLYARGKFARHFANPFSGEKKQRFESAATAFDEGKPLEAAEQFSPLFEQYPTLSPLAVRVAEAYAKADDLEQAETWLLKAIAAGWFSGTYVKDSEALAPLLEDDRVAKLVDTLSDAPISLQGPVGFSGSLGWTQSGNPVKHDQGGIHYMLSCMLAVVHDRGSTVDQAIRVLERSSEADHTHPEATFGFAKTGDVRSKTRFPGFADALVWLTSRGHQTEVFTSSLPGKLNDYVGLMLGTASMDLVGKPWRLVPGAIAESLTSHGGNFSNRSQTKLTELLHAGAAMSSGTVTEPYSLQFKFPLPIMHGYYGEGTSALEAFYLSVTCPYQLLIVGDPLCQPFARPPGEMVRIRLDGEQGNRVKIRREALNLSLPQSPTRGIEIFLEDKLIRSYPPKETIEMKLPEELSGAVNVRVVLVGHHITRPRLGFSETLELRGPLTIPTAESQSSGGGQTTAEPSADETVRVELRCQGADRIELMLAGERAGQVDGGEGTLTLERKRWGDGPLRVRPVAHFDSNRVPGREVWVGKDG